MTFRRAVAIAATVGVVAGLGAVLWIRPWQDASAATPRYTTVRVERGPLAAKVTATGTLSARNTVEVGAQVSGRLVEIAVDFNDRVRTGQVIARLDPAVLDAQLTAAKANLAVAEADRVKADVARADADRQLARQQALRADNLIAATTVEAAEVTADNARAAQAAAAAQVTQARAAVAQARLNLGYATITSPVDGVVISRDVDVGQTVAASLSAPTLFTIAEDLARMQIDTSVGESDVGKISTAMKATFTVDAFPGRTFEGSVRQVRNAPTTVSNVVTYNAVIDVDNTDGGLRPGMTATVVFVLDEVADAVLIPSAALRFKPTMDEAMAMLGGRGPGGPGGPGGSGALPRGATASGGGGPPAMPGGPPPGGGPGGSGGAGLPADRKVVWKLVRGAPQPVPIKLGVSDGSRTAIVEGDLAAGDELITEATGLPKNTFKPPGSVF
jgi:HlyD family secretion protein